MENFYKSVSGQRQKPESYRIHIYGLRASVECERGANIQPAEIESQIRIFFLFGSVYVALTASNHYFFEKNYPSKTAWLSHISRFSKIVFK